MKKYFKRLSPFLLIVSALLLAFSFTSDASRTTYRSRGLYPSAVNFNATWPGLQTFTATGTWYRPPGIEHVLTIIAGGGGGGSGGEDAADGGGGGSGGVCKAEVVDVRGASSQTVTIGTGGAGGAFGANGSAGVASSFGALVTAAGGTAGDKTTYSIAESSGPGGGHGGMYFGGTGTGQAGGYGHLGAGGAAGGVGGGGGGGGGSYGAGGAGGAADGNGVAAAANTGGGGGAGGDVDGIGAAGGSGICIVIPLPRGFTLP